MAIYRGPGGSGDATDDAANAAELIIQKTDEAAAYAAAASTSATNAAASAVSAAASASGVSASAAAAAASAAAALVSETNAAASEANAATSETNADADATTATTKASEAAASASAASSSASSASTSASNASTSASNAASSASSASSSASAASTSASNAAISESNAASSAALAAGFFPSATGNTGKYLRTNGTTNYWDTVDALPSQTSNSGKFLTTNGTTASWATIAGATPTDDGLVYGLTDAGTYYPPATVSGAWFAELSSTSIYTSTDGDYNGQTNPENIVVNIANGTISVGKTLILVLTELSTSNLVQVNAGAITAVSYVNTGGSTNHSASITFTNSINWSLYQHSSVFFYSRLIVDSLILSGNKAENAILGYNAGNNITTGGENVIVGSGAASTLTEGRNNVIIGNSAQSTAATTNNEVTLGNSSHTKTRLFGALAVGGSSTGTSGQVLTSAGSSTAPSWTTLPLPDPATPLVDGIVYGQTDDEPGLWSGTITNNGNYLYYADGGNYNISFAASSAVGVAAAAGQVAVGQLITINDGTTTRDFGVITGVTAADPTYITTSLKPYGSSLIDIKYCATMTLVGSPGGNVGLGYNIYDNINNGSYNTVIGFNAGASVVDGNNNIVIGYNANTSSTSAANEVTIGNTDITKTRLRGAILVGNSTPSAGTSGQVLTSNGSSSAPSWTTLTSGTVTSVALSAPTGLTVAGSPITSSGTLALSYTAGYSIPTTSSQTNWDTAYGWGNHASAGYLTSATAASTYAPLTGTGTSGTWGISITGNAATVTNGLYSIGSYSDPTWLTTLAGSKITGTINGGTY